MAVKDKLISNECLKAVYDPLKSAITIVEEIAVTATDLQANITSGGEISTATGGLVALITLEDDAADYAFTVTGRETPCRVGFSDTYWTADPSLQLEGITSVSDGETIHTDGTYSYMYVYYRSGSYPSATVSVKRVIKHYTDTTLAIPGKPADAETVGNKINNLDTATYTGALNIDSLQNLLNAAIDANGELSANVIGKTAKIPLIASGVYKITITNRDTACRAGYSNLSFKNTAIQLDNFTSVSNGDVIVSTGEYQFLYVYTRGASYPDTVISVDLIYSSANADYLRGKTVVAIGDSLIYGYGIERNETWLALLSKEHQFTAYNYGVSGNPVGISTEDPDGMCVRIDDVLEEHPVFDYFILEGGANDMWKDVPIGDVKLLNPEYNYTPGTKYGESTDPASTYKYLPNLDKETFCGAVNYIIKTVQDTCPTARILVLTNYNRKRGRTNSLGKLDEDYVNAMIECCKFMGVPYIDNYHDIGLNIVSDAMRSWVDTGDQHINPAGHMWLKNIYCQKLISI